MRRYKPISTLAVLLAWLIVGAVAVLTVDYIVHTCTPGDRQFIEAFEVCSTHKFECMMTLPDLKRYKWDKENCSR